MELVPVPIGMTRRRGAARRREPVIQVGKSRVFDEPVSHVDAKSVDSAVQPKLQYRFELPVNLRIGPVKVGLFRGEQVEVPLLWITRRSGHGRPRRATEAAHPVIGRL